MYQAPEVFIDSSYVSYFNIFSTWKWYKQEYIFDDNDYRLNGDFNPMEDKNYEKMLEHKFLASIYGVLQQVIPFIDKSKILFAIDCDKKDIWRNHYYPLYKSHRYNKKFPFNLKPSFDFLLKELLPIHCENQNSKMLQVNNAEADDIIATIILQKYKQTQDTNNIVIASDRDLSQLCPYTKMYDLTKEEIMIESTYRHDKVLDVISDPTNVGDFLLYKALKGDNSDKISGFLPRTGPKTAVKYINNKEELKRICEEKPEALKNLKTNLKIMNLEKIPDNIKADIWEQYKEICEKLNYN